MRTAAALRSPAAIGVFIRTVVCRHVCHHSVSLARSQHGFQAWLIVVAQRYWRGQASRAAAVAARGLRSRSEEPGTGDGGGQGD